MNIYGTGMTPAWMGSPTSDYDLTKEFTNSSPGNPPLPYPPYQYNALRTIAWRHRGGAMVCFFDGHVAYLRKDEIYMPGPGGTKLPNSACGTSWTPPRRSARRSPSQVLPRRIHLSPVRFRPCPFFPEFG